MIKESDSIILSADIKKQLRYLAIDGYPNEVCGVLHSHNIVHQYANTFSGDHELGFDMEVDIIDCDIKAIWHSHPGGLREPSHDDIPCMEQLASHGYAFPWLIVTPKEVTQWIFESSSLISK